MVVLEVVLVDVKVLVADVVCDVVTDVVWVVESHLLKLSGQTKGSSPGKTGTRNGAHVP